MSICRAVRLANPKSITISAITITPDYGDDFTPIRTNEFIDVCQPHRAADCDVNSLDGECSNGWACDICHDFDGPLLRQV